MEPWRARPVPFCLYGFLPPPRTSPRVFTLCVPCRAAASWATTTWCISGMLACTLKTSSGSATARARSPSADSTSTLSSEGMSLTALLRRRAEQHQRTLGARDSALDQDQVLVRVDRLDGQVLHGVARVAHAPGHAYPLEDPARRGAGADRTGRAVLALDTVARLQAVEAVPLHHAGETLALGTPGDVHDLAGREGLRRHLLAECVLAGVGGAQLDDVPARRHVRLGVVAGGRLVDLARIDRAERELDRAVAVLVRGTDLGDHARAGLHHGDRDNLVVVPHLSHAELGAQDALDLPVHQSVPYSLISMSTPAGRSRRMSESTVLGVGSMMSISRLCVRISKCSRESLYLCGERMTQKRLISVGSGTGPATCAPVRVTVSTILRAEESTTSWSYALSRMRIFCPAMVASVSFSRCRSRTGLPPAWPTPAVGRVARPHRIPPQQRGETGSLAPRCPGAMRGWPTEVSHPAHYAQPVQYAVPGYGIPNHLRILVTRPAPTVRPPSRMANRRPSSMAIGWIS